jgi:hypothetical protein
MTARSLGRSLVRSTVKPGVQVVLVALVLVGCAANASGGVIDGWPVGPRADCSKLDCGAYIRAANGALQRRDPDRPSVVDVTLYAEGDSAPLRTTPCCSVAVFTLANGSVKAIGVGKNILGDIIVTQDFGP